MWETLEFNGQRTFTLARRQGNLTGIVIVQNLKDSFTAIIKSTVYIVNKILWKITNNGIEGLPLFCPLHMETSWLICSANQLSGFRKKGVLIG